MPHISVLMPCYNAAATLDEAMDSLVSQSLVDFEIVAVDDGSQDDTADRLAQWAARDTRLRVITMPHQGIVPALNAGLQVCQGAYIARMDADDLCHPERLERQSGYLDEHPQTGLVGCLVAGFPDNAIRDGFRRYLAWLNGLLTDEQIRREIFIESPFPHPSVMFRREVVLAVGGYQEHGWAEDYDLWLRLYLTGVGFAKVPETLLCWREGSARLTRTDERYSQVNFMRLRAHYLARGPLLGCDAVLIWGAGMLGRRLGRFLEAEGVPPSAFVDVDPALIGRQRRNAPVLSFEMVPAWLQSYERPVLLTAVGQRGARQLIRAQLEAFGLVEGIDWWSVA
jgi:glycosyltransferase involved in cell wall biosynthesis